MKITCLAASFAAIFLTGCPGGEEPKPRAEISSACAQAYAVYMVDAAGSEHRACSAAALVLVNDPNEWDRYHRQVWDNPANELVEACGGNNSDIRLELLSEREIMRFRCIVGYTSPDNVCEGYDPTLCMND